MKRIIVALIFFTFVTSVFSQGKSLLWEISGNGLEKPSYIYGTMHVSSKVAFRLDDVFYEALHKSECIALESDPTQWLKFMHEDFGYNPYLDNGLYSNNFYPNLFRVFPLDPLQIRNIIRFDNYLINSYLYRKNSYADDFEEETYLDMFIYQAGKKNGKPIIGLEDFKESRYLTTKASYNINKRKPDNWFIKLMEKKDMFLYQEDVYRQRNIELLDSIGAATNTNYYREHMLFKRNENMVSVLDTLMPKKIVFSGVGAAHLGGEKGMLNMLREKGYIVKPLVSGQTVYAKKEKHRLDHLFTTPTLSYHATSDGFMRIKSFDKLREFSAEGIKYYVAPDMTNGAYLTINRLNTFEYLPNKKDKVDLSFIKNMLYEDVPGTIIEKTEFDKPFPGISILNKTKKGDYQKYHIYKTPLEIIVVKFGGKKDFVLQHQAEIFESIDFKPYSKNLITFTEPYGKYRFACPENYITSNLEHPGKKLIQAKSDKGYYFFQESPQHDTEYIEEDEFEAKYIHTSFYKNLKIEGFDGNFTNGAYKAYTSSVVLDSVLGQKLWLKSVVKDGSYYLMGFYGSEQDKATSFFNSLHFQEADYETFKQEKDTSLYFTVNSPTKAPIQYNARFHNGRKKPYEESVKNTTYTTKANEQIAIKRTKFHDLRMFENIDSLWHNADKSLHIPHLKDMEFNKEYLKVDEKRHSENGINYFAHKLRDSGSSKEILVKYIQKKGVLYKLVALKDSIAKPSRFLTEFFDSFQPRDTLLGKDVFKDKTQVFFDALKNDDSIALNGYKAVVFSKTHTSKIISFLDSYTFPENKTNIKNHIIEQLIKNDNGETVNAFVRKLYVESYSDPSVQNVILDAVFQRGERTSYEFILKLLSTDIPLGAKTLSFVTHNATADALKTAKVLFPELLDFSVVEEYKSPIYGLLTKLLDSNALKPNGYKKFKKQIINDAKIELKRSLSNKKSYSHAAKKDFKLDNYVKLLFPFRNEKNVKLFYGRLLETEDWEALTTYYVLLKSKNESIPEKLKAKTLLNEPAQHFLISKLKLHDILDKSETALVDLKAYAKSKLFANFHFRKSENEIVLLEQKLVETDTGKPIHLYIFKRTNKRNNNENDHLHAIAFEDSKTDMYHLKPYYTTINRGVMISGFKTEEAVMENIILSIKHKTRKRVRQSRY